MKLRVDLYDLRVETPAWNSLDEETQEALLRYRFGFEQRDFEVMNRYRTRVKILMPEIDCTSSYDYSEIALLSFAMPQMFFDKDVLCYPGAIPVSVLAHYQQARTTGAFEKFNIYAKSSFRSGLIFAESQGRSYRIAGWQGDGEKRPSLSVLKRQRRADINRRCRSQSGGIIFGGI